MKFSELVFKTHPNAFSGFSTQAVVTFGNGYGASVVTGRSAYTSRNKPYELAVLKDGKLCYDSGYTDDVIGYLDPDGVEKILNDLEAL